MKPTLGIVIGLGLSAVSAARADEVRPNRVRSSASVEVIDDARHVDDIISRMKAQPRTPPPREGLREKKGPAASDAPPDQAQVRPERPPLRTETPERLEPEHRGGKNPGVRRERHEREREHEHPGKRRR